MGDLILSDKQRSNGRINREKYVYAFVTNLIYIPINSLDTPGNFGLVFSDTIATTRLAQFLKAEWMEPRAEHRAHAPLLISRHAFLASTLRIPRIGRVEAKSRRGTVAIVVIEEGLVFAKGLQEVLRLFDGDFEVFGRVFGESSGFNASTTTTAYGGDVAGGEEWRGGLKGEWRDGVLYKNE